MAVRKKKPTRKKIEASLLDQLWKNGGLNDHFQDLVYDYMNFYDIKEKLEQDIIERGTHFSTLSASGNPIDKQNPSTKELMMVNKQMLMILEKLKLNTDTVGAGEEDEL